MSEPSRSGNPAKNEGDCKTACSPGRAGPSVAKEDVNVKNPGKQPREVPAADAKPKKKAGKRLMDYTG